MASDLDAARRFAVVDDQEARLLTGPERPIVLVQRRAVEGPTGGGVPAKAVAPASDVLGVMLPAMPLHHLIAAGLPPLVAAPADADRALIAAIAAAVEPGPLEVRVLAIEELGLLGDVRAVPLVRRILLAEPQVALQRAAVRALRALGTAQAVSVLDEALKSGRLSSEGSREVLAALPSLRWEASRAALTWASVNGASYELRFAAEAALARFGPPPVSADFRLEDSP